MIKRRIALSVGSLLLLIGLVISDGRPLVPGGLAGGTIIRTPDGLRLEVPVDWTVDVDRAGTTFANSAEALAASMPPPQTFRALVVSGRLEDLPLPERVERSELAAALAADEDHRGASVRGDTGDGQTLLVVKGVAPDVYAGVFASAARSPTFPHRGELEEIVGDLRRQALETESSPGTLNFWLEHVQDIHRFEQEPQLWYDLLVPDGEAPASGWPVLALTHASTASYASIAQDRLAIIVTPHFTWNTFEEDRQILNAVLAEVAASHRVDERRLIVHGCSVGGRFAFQYTITEPNRVMAAVPMAAFDLSVPPPESWHIPFVFFYGDHDPLYAAARPAIEGMQKRMDAVALYLDAGQGHVCDPALGLEAIRALLAE